MDRNGKISRTALMIWTHLETYCDLLNPYCNISTAATIIGILKAPAQPQAPWSFAGSASKPHTINSACSNRQRIKVSRVWGARW